MELGSNYHHIFLGHNSFFYWNGFKCNSIKYETHWLHLSIVICKKNNKNGNGLEDKKEREKWETFLEAPRRWNKREENRKTKIDKREVSV